MKRKLGIFVCLMLVLTALVLNVTKSNLNAKEIEPSNILRTTVTDILNSKVDELEDIRIAAQQAVDAGCYISAFEIKTTKDGTAKFDIDDEVGNDSNDSNGRVRTFDYINYNLEYVTAIEDLTKNVDSAYVNIEFTLEKDPSEAVLNPDTFKWCENMVTTYYYEDGTNATTWNQDKIVLKQVLTGRRKITNNAEINAIPGVGTLSFGVYVKGAKNGDTIKPKFKCWIEGSDIKQECESNEILITAAPRYNIKLVEGGGIANYEALSYIDLNNGTYQRNEKSEDELYGRFNGLTARLQLLNTSADKGLKGVELPHGNIEFDIRLQAICNNVDVTNEINYTPILWDYKNNDNISGKGNLNRTMYIYNSYYAYSAQSTSFTARDNYFNRSANCVWDAGNYTVEQTSNNTYHVVLKDYGFDLDQFYFPYRYINNQVTSYNKTDNEADFSAIRFMFFQQMPRNIDSTSSLTFKAYVENPNFTSISGAKCTLEMNTSDNIYGRGITVYPKGTYSQQIILPYPSIASIWGAKDGQAMTSQRASYSSYVTISNERGLWSSNLLVTFDDKSIELDGKNSANIEGYYIEKGNVKFLYAAKPDKSGWTSEEEMKNAREENLIYFTSLEELKAEGYTNVGILYERRNCEIYYRLAYTSYFNVKADANPGHICMFKVSSRGWTNETDTDMMSWTDVKYKDNDNIYGLGSSDEKWKKGTYMEGYNVPTYDINGNYSNPIYEDGKIINNGIGGQQEGTSLLVLGDKTSVSIAPIDNKVSYDMDLNERVVTYKVVPQLTGNVTSNTDNVYVTVDIPKDLHYNLGTASMEPISVIENSDGSTTLKWIIYNQKIGSAITPITFDATIGKAGTKEDVVNGQQIMVKARISSDYDQRKQQSSFGNYYENTINVIKLATSSISKTVERELVEEGEEFSWTLNYGNTSEISVEQVRMYDVLPYNGDGRGTSFNGSYKIKEVVFDFKDAPRTFENVSEDTNVMYTSSNDVRTRDKSELTLMNGVDSSWSNLGNKRINESEIIFENIDNLDITALYLDIGGNVEGNEFISIKFKAMPVNEATKQQTKDIYVNSFYQYATNQIAVVNSNIAKVEVVERNISGLAWLDMNKNGLQDEGEEKFSNKEVRLYRVDKSNKDTEETTTSVGDLTLYNAYDVFGNKVEKVTTNTNGEYRFEHLEQGEYVVVMNDLEIYKVTAKNVGNNPVIDSDAQALHIENSRLKYAGVTNIVLPTLENMPSSEYSSKNNDFGYYYNTFIDIVKTDKEGNNLAGATLQLLDKNDKLVEEWITTTEARRFDGILDSGELYKLREIKAASGYGYAEDIEFRANQDGTKMTITMQDSKTLVEISKLNVDNELIAGAKLQIIDESRNVVVDNITSTTEAIEIEGILNANQKYILHEVSAPSKYILANDVEFVVAKDGTAQVSMIDEYAKGKLKIVKKDSNNEFLSGVVFEITDEFGAVIEEITTDEEGIAQTKDLIVGTYYYKEKSVPENIVKDENKYEFNLVNDGEVITKNIENKIITGSVKITKKIGATDNSQEELLRGAKFNATLKSDTSKVFGSVEVSNGIYVIDGLQYGEYVIEEIVVPSNTLKCENYEIFVNEDGKVYEKTIVDIPKKMQITIYKEDAENGEISQADATLENAEYTIYKDRECTREIEKLVITKGEDGKYSAKSGKYLVGTYYIKETKAPTGYLIDDTIYEVSQNADEQIVELSSHSITLKDTVIKGNIEILKKIESTDYDPEVSLAGVQFSATLKKDKTKVYTSNVSDESGVCRIDNLPYGTYEIEEIKMPNEALKYENFKIVVNENGKTYSKTIVDTRKTMQIEINKKLLEETVQKTDAKVDGACFTVYTDEECSKEYVDKNGQNVVIGPTNSNGYVLSNSMKIGTYYLKETTFPEGINPDALIKNENVTYRDKVYKVEATESGKYSLEVLNVPNFGSVEIVKYDEILGSDTNRPSKGAILRLTLKSNPNVYYDATIGEDGTAKFENAKLKELGYEYTIPYGKYEITEIKASDIGEHTYYYINPENVTIENNEQKEYRVFTDKPVEMYLKIVKRDSDTNNIVSVSGAKFKIWNMSLNKWVSQNNVEEFITNSEGNIVLSEKLSAGEYIIYEVESPEGYYLEDEYRIPQDAPKIGDKNYGGKYVNIDKQAVGIEGNYPIEGRDLIYTIEMSDRPLKGKMEIHKVGPVFTDVITTTTKYGEKYEPKFELKEIEGVKYNIVAAEDIKSKDGKSTYVSKGTIVDTIVTGENGTAITDELYLGKYNIVEIDAPNGYILNDVVETQVLNDNSIVRVNIIEKELENRKQKVNLEFIKEFERIEYLNGNEEERKAVFGLFAKEDIKNSAGRIIIKSNSLLDIMETDEEYKVSSSIDLPEGKYYVKELEVSSPYYISTSNYDFEVVYDKSNEDLSYTVNDGKITNNIEYASIALVKVSTSTYIDNVLVNGMEIDKTNLDENTLKIIEELSNKTYKEVVEYIEENNIYAISGAEYTLYLDNECTKSLIKINEDGTRQEAKLIIEDDGIGILEKVPFGTYYVKETKNPSQMELSEEVLMVEITKENQDSLVCSLAVDEYVVEALIDKKDIFTGEAVPNCIFEITDESGEVILRSITDEKGKAGIPAKLFENGRKYYYEEIDAPEMYEINTQKQEFIVSFDEETYEWTTQKVTFENERESKELKILKVDDKTGKPLSGCVFSIALLDENGNIKTREDGTPIYLVENAVTNESGEYLIEKAYYGTYKFTEVKAPEGYELNEKDMEGYVFTIDKNSSDRIDFIVTNTGDIAVITISVIAIISIIGIVYVMIKNKNQQVK